MRLIILLLLLILPKMFGFDVYIEEKNATVGVPFTLVINASDYSGKVKGKIDFGNYVIVWECVNLNHQVIKYNIVSSKTEGKVLFQLENNKTFMKNFKLSPNPNYRPFYTSLTYINEKNCVFEEKKNINEKDNKKEIIEKNSNLFIKYFMVILLLFVLVTFIAAYFYKIGKKEAETLIQSDKVVVSPLKRKLIKLLKEKDYKKKAFMLYKLINENENLKNKLDEGSVHKIYMISFKKDVSEEDKKFIDELIQKVIK